MRALKWSLVAGLFIQIAALHVPADAAPTAGIALSAPHAARVTFLAPSHKRLKKLFRGS
jgi:hypothetical protein